MAVEIAVAAVAGVVQAIAVIVVTERRWRRRRSGRWVDRHVFTHDYVGADTRWGLQCGTPCQILGHGAAGGGRRVATPEGERYIVSARDLRRITR